MKPSLKIVVVLFFLSFTTNKDHQDSNITDISIFGEWENKQFQVEYRFTEDGNAYFAQGGFGQNMEYSLDTTKTPIWLDFKMSQGNYTATIPALLKIVDKNTIWIEQFSSSSKHPTEFSENGATVNKKHVLTRVQ